jgi:hypothetical protein
MEDEFEGQSLDDLANRAAEAFFGGTEHPYERLSDLILVMLDQAEQHERDAQRTGSPQADRMARVLRAAIIELRIANDVAAPERDRRFFVIQGVRSIVRYMELD